MTTDTAAAPAPGVRRRPWVGRVALVVAVVAMLAWWASPGTMPTYSRDSATSVLPPPVGEPAYVAVGFSVYPGDGPVHVLWARPRVTIGASHTRAELVTCKTGPDGGVGFVYGDVSQVCVDERPAAGATLREDDQLLLRLVGDEPWPSLVDGIDIAYIDGWRPGLQRAGSPVLMQPVEPTAP